MNPEDKEILRERILIMLRRVTPKAVPLRAVHEGLLSAGFKLTPDAAEAECKFLAEKGLVAFVQSQLSVSLQTYAITAAGREYLESAGLD